MNNEIAIKITNLTKIYHLYDKPQDRLKEALNPFKKSYHHDFYALDNMCFEIKKGETVGIIGKNGAGKSTLLKIITGVLTPSSGSIEVNGKIASLLELGAGFNPEMTGLENIYLNGTLMGFSKKEMDTKINFILNFADIGEFIHQPVKMYSSGMFARLAFSVAINVDPDILIVDEALSVGDMLFQAKCISKMTELMKQGTTILFVSHDIHSVRSLCNKGIYLEKGQIKAIGSAGKIVDLYINDDQQKSNEGLKDNILYEKIESDNCVDYQKNNPIPSMVDIKTSIIETDEMVRYGDKGAEILDYTILDLNFNKTNELVSKGDYYIQMAIKFNEDLPTFVITTTVFHLNGEQLLAWINTQDHIEFPSVSKDDIVIATIKVNFPLKPGIYKLGASVEFPTVPLVRHRYLDMIKGIKFVNANFKSTEESFHSTFFSSGEYFLQKTIKG